MPRVIQVKPSEHPLVINIRGVSGSGKTTAMRKIMDNFSKHPIEQLWKDYMVKGRRNPLGHFLGSVFVLGNYNSAICGGCDTIGSARQTYDALIDVAKLGEFKIILCEGLMLSADVKWTIQIPNIKPVFLSTPLEECLARVKMRRQAAENDKPFNEERTRRRQWEVERARERLSEHGMNYHLVSDNESVQLALKWINDAIRT